MTTPAAQTGRMPHLYHTPSSYYSMIARLALAEGGVAYTPALTDIHVRLEQQRPDYVRLNPNMTVPTLVLADRVLTESREIAAFALGVDEAGLDEESRAWLDLHYALPIEELTFGRLLARNKMARLMVPKVLGRAQHLLLAHAAQNPDLAPLYEARAAVFAERIRVFDPAAAVRLAAARQAQAVEILARMEQVLGDGRAVLVPPRYGIADVVLTVFLGRMEFTGMGAEIQRRPAVARYWQAIQARPGFAAADIWTKFHPLRMVAAILRAGRG